MCPKETIFVQKEKTETASLLKCMKTIYQLPIMTNRQKNNSFTLTRRIIKYTKYIIDKQKWLIV